MGEAQINHEKLDWVAQKPKNAEEIKRSSRKNMEEITL